MDSVGWRQAIGVDGAGEHAFSSDTILFFGKDDQAQGSAVAQAAGSFCAPSPRLLVFPLRQLSSDARQTKNS